MVLGKVGGIRPNRRRNWRERLREEVLSPIKHLRGIKVASRGRRISSRGREGDGGGDRIIRNRNGVPR